MERWVRKPNLSRVFAARRAVAGALAGPADLFVSHLPHCTWWCARGLTKGKARVPHMAFAFNFTDLPTGWRRRSMTRAFQSVDRFVVFSSYERDLYSDYFRIPTERIDTLLWGVQPPDVSHAAVSPHPRDYLCAVGANARDYPTLLRAMEMVPEAELVVIARPRNLPGLRVPPNVTVLVDLPLERVWGYVHHSRFMALPLRDDRASCGHVTLVSAMHLGKAVAATFSHGLTDYIADGHTGRFSPPRDPAALAEVIRQLWRDPAMCQRIGDNARAFAQASCNEQATARYMAGYIAGLGLMDAATVASRPNAHAFIQ